MDDWWDTAVPEAQSPSICSCFIALRPGAKAARLLLQTWANLCDGEHANQPAFNIAIRLFQLVRKG